MWTKATTQSNQVSPYLLSQIHDELFNNAENSTIWTLLRLPFCFKIAELATNQYKSLQHWLKFTRPPPKFNVPKHWLIRGSAEKKDSQLVNQLLTPGLFWGGPGKGRQMNRLPLGFHGFWNSKILYDQAPMGPLYAWIYLSHFVILSNITARQGHCGPYFLIRISC